MKRKGNTLLKMAAGILLVFQLTSVESAYSQDKDPAKGGITLSFDIEDSVKIAKATVTKVDAEGKTVPAAGVEMNIYAKKSYGLLPLGEPQSTDENGEIKVEFPNDLPGDPAGNITVVAKFEDNEELGSMETSGTVKWGVPLVLENEMHKRALWASGGNAPLPLVITVTSMVVGVWGVIIYIIVLLFKIKKSATYEIKNQD